MARRDPFGSVAADVNAVMANRPPEPKPRRKRYPSDEATPAIATRLPRESYEEFKTLAKATNRKMALVARVILLDWLERHEADGERELDRLVTREEVAS